MKKSVVVGLFALIATPLSQTVAASDYEDTCRAYYLLAEQIMLGRQEMLPMPDALEFMDGDDRGRQIVMRAYRHPQVTSDELRQRIVRNFSDEEFRRCMEIHE